MKFVFNNDNIYVTPYISNMKELNLSNKLRNLTPSYMDTYTFALKMNEITKSFYNFKKCLVKKTLLDFQISYL